MPKLYFLASTALLLGLVLSSCSEPRTGVWTDEGQLFTENGPYFIQGVCYHPVPVGEQQRSFEHTKGSGHLAATPQFGRAAPAPR